LPRTLFCRCVATVSYAATFLFHLISGMTETTTVMPRQV